MSASSIRNVGGSPRPSISNNCFYLDSKRMQQLTLREDIPRWYSIRQSSRRKQVFRLLDFCASRCCQKQACPSSGYWKCCPWFNRTSSYCVVLRLELLDELVGRRKNCVFSDEQSNPFAAKRTHKTRGGDGDKWTWRRPWRGIWERESKKAAVWVHALWAMAGAVKASSWQLTLRLSTQKHSAPIQRCPADTKPLPGFVQVFFILDQTKVHRRNVYQPHFGSFSATALISAMRLPIASSPKSTSY